MISFKDLLELKLPTPLFDLKRKCWVIVTGCSLDSADESSLRITFMTPKNPVAIKFDSKRYSLSDPKADAKEKKILTDSPWPHY